jgi:hypothetical protein
VRSFNPKTKTKNNPKNKNNKIKNKNNKIKNKPKTNPKNKTKIRDQPFF